MHTKGKAAKDLKEELGLDTCIYLGNDINDITMFSNALDDNDFIVIANNEYHNITEMLLEQLREECKLKGIDWNTVRLLVLKEENVNSFLHRISKILAVLNSERKPQNIRQRYKHDVKPVKRNFKTTSRETRKRNYGGRFHG